MTGEQLTLGASLKQAGQMLVADHNASFIACMRTIAKAISTRKGQVTSDDLREAAEAHRLKPTSPNAWGAVFKERGWVIVGRVHSVLASNHYREIRVWKWEPTT